MSHAVFKRRHDCVMDTDMTNEPSSSCSPRRMDALSAHEVKKLRRNDEMSDSNRQVIMGNHNSNPSPFYPPQSTAQFLDAFSESHIPATRDAGSNQIPSSDSNSMANLIFGEPKKKEKKYTSSEVQRIVAEALSCREQQLREEYENQLKTMLQQQFESFHNYHQEFISRRLRTQDSTYIS